MCSKKAPHVDEKKRPLPDKCLKDEKTMVIYNVDIRVKKADLLELCRKCGIVESLKASTLPSRTPDIQVWFCLYANKSYIPKAVVEIDGTAFYGRPIRTDRQHGELSLRRCKDMYDDELTRGWKDMAILAYYQKPRVPAKPFSSDEKTHGTVSTTGTTTGTTTATTTDTPRTSTPPRSETKSISSYSQSYDPFSSSDADSEDRNPSPLTLSPSAHPIAPTSSFSEVEREIKMGVSPAAANRVVRELTELVEGWKNDLGTDTYILLSQHLFDHAVLRTLRVVAHSV